MATTNMLALDIEIDGAHIVSAGAEDWSLLSLHVTAGREKPDPQGCDGYIEYSVGGLTLPDSEGIHHHFRWPTRELKVGSVVTVRVVEIATVDAPAKRYRSDAKVRESPFTEEEERRMRYEDYLDLKAEFEPDSKQP